MKKPDEEDRKRTVKLLLDFMQQINSKGKKKKEKGEQEGQGDPRSVDTVPFPPTLRPF
jgi:hypothetical protein